MLNVQFMDARNGIPTGETNWRGEPNYRYIPNFDEMRSNASCEEEIKAINEAEAYINEGLLDGFPFEIVYTAKTRIMDFNTGKMSIGWAVLQHPWYEDERGNKQSKEYMIDDIRKSMAFDEMNW